MSRLLLLLAICLLAVAGLSRAESDDSPAPTADENLGKSKQGSATDDEVVARDEERIKIDGLNVSQMKELRDGSEKHAFEAEVSRMMKLIINSLYRNKEIFLRELISNSSDALDKIRFLSLTEKSQLDSKPETTIRIKADKENHILHITDSGIGMTKTDLINNLGTIAKSGTSEFVAKMGEAKTDSADLIGQFGVGFYSAFLVADTVVVTSKHNDDEQHIWESNAGEFTVSKDPRGNTLGRGTCVSLFLKEEAYDFVEQDTLKTLITKYSQFINFPIYLWSSKTIEVEEEIEDDEEATPEAKSDEEGSVEESKEESKPKTEKVEKTVWDWEKMNAHKPLWTRSPRDVGADEYTAFYKSFSKDENEPGAHMHFVAEGEVSFRSILFIPKDAPRDYESKRDDVTRNMKLYVRRVFITDELTDLMPKYLDFIRGVVDSDDLPLNVSRENLQQHKLLKVIRKKLVRKALDMIKKIPADKYMHFFKQFGHSLKMGVIDDHSNRTRLAKLLRFHSSNGSEMISLTEYQERMKEKQEYIYFMAGASVDECKKSPFVEQLLKKGFEVLYLVDPIDEYTLQQVAEFEGKKFQNVAKDGLVIGENTDSKKQRVEALQTQFKPLVTFLEKTALKEKIEKVVVSQRLSESPCALVANQWGWSGNMDRIMRAQGVHRQNQESHMFEQKKIFEINPYHPLIKALLTSVEEDESSDRTKDLAVVLYETAVLRSGFAVPDTVSFASRIERMLRVSAGVSEDAQVEEPEEADEEVVEEEEEEVAAEEEPAAEEEEPAQAEPETKDEL